MITRILLRSLLVRSLLAIGASCLASVSYAADFYVQDTIAENGVASEDARAATTLIKNSVALRQFDDVTENEPQADFVLQPRLMKLGDNFVLTIEKLRGNEILHAAQTKIARIEDLDLAARRVTATVIMEPGSKRRGVASDLPPAVPYTEVVPTPRRAPASEAPPIVAAPRAEAGTSQAGFPTGWEPRKINYWTIGIGPMIGRNLENDSLMYGLNIGHTWDINPRASLKVLAEGNFGDGDEDARLFNFAAGGTYFLPGSYDSAPFVTGDLGYGFAQSDATGDAEGFSFGTGVGFQFFRTTETTLDLLLRYSTILDDTDKGEGNPSVIGVRLAVNF